MKRLLPFLFTLLATPGCGFYTNIPAEVVVTEIQSASLVYGGGINEAGIKITEPTCVLRTNPGSIGADFTDLLVNYYNISGAQIASTDIPPMKLYYTIHVDGSNFSANPLDTNAPMPQPDVGKNIWVGRTIVTLPVVTRHVEQYGSRPNPPDGNYAGISAKVTLSGKDEALFPITVVFSVPIMFSGVAK
jgi:hypothetical protein